MDKDDYRWFECVDHSLNARFPFDWEESVSDLSRDRALAESPYARSAADRSDE